MRIAIETNSAVVARAVCFIAAALAAAATMRPALAQAPAWSPQRPAEIVCTAAPGGNQDITARAIQAIWQKRRIVSPVVVMNKPGGGGAIAYDYMSQHAGDPHYLFMIPPTLLTNHIMGKTSFRHTDLTPVGMLFHEYIFVSVKADSPLKNGKDLIERLKAAPDSLSVAVAAAIGNHIHMGIVLPMKMAGVNIKKMKVVAFNSSGQSVTALLGGHIDVAASTFGSVLPHLEAGRVRVIGVSAPQRLTGRLATIPTWSEQGALVSVSGWRGLAASKNIIQAQIEYWESALAALAQTAEWKEDLVKYHRQGYHTTGNETRKFLDAQYAEFESALTELGLAKAP